MENNVWLNDMWQYIDETCVKTLAACIPKILAQYNISGIYIPRKVFIGSLLVSP